MACNSCSKTFSLLRKEKGCPACGFSYCSNCLKSKIFVTKLNSEAKVCSKCQQAVESQARTKIQPPDVYYKRIGCNDLKNKNISTVPLNYKAGSSKDQEIADRLKKLKDDTCKSSTATNEDIANRLQKIKEDVHIVSDAELQSRLANLKGVTITTLQSKPIAIVPDNRTEQEQVEDLLKQYTEQTKIDGNYQDQFQSVIENIQARLQKLKAPAASDIVKSNSPDPNMESDNEEGLINSIIKKVKSESKLEIENSKPELDELPFCEICNEDAKMRCLGCKYLFCRRCYKEHEDEDDGCNKYVSYPS